MINVARWIPQLWRKHHNKSTQAQARISGQYEKRREKYGEIWENMGKYEKIWENRGKYEQNIRQEEKNMGKHHKNTIRDGGTTTATHSKSVNVF